ncbi:FxSxx-COOH system tetratricopeptide repeat protein [Nocardiopsis aegyptia]|uniref:FxSxx-COOH system tetratricopeptide repeat protein n=1 Tax=Nocardiopsis aegyptia TaxID=220378 RepID=UPI00366CFC27
MRGRSPGRGTGPEESRTARTVESGEPENRTRASGDGRTDERVPGGGGLPGPSALSDRQSLLASLRPFHLRERAVPDEVPDPTASARGLASALLESAYWTDEERAVGGVAVPAAAGPGERRVTDLTLVVDAGTSMGVHKGVVDAFARLLRTSGAFRRVRRVTFDSAGTGAPRPRDGHGRRADPWGRGGIQIVLVLTDGLGTAWRDSGFHEWMIDLGHRAATAVVHLLDPRLWRRSGLNPVPVRLRARWNARPGHANDRYLVEGVHGVPSPEGTVFPVFSLKAGALRDWASFAMARRAEEFWTPVTVFPAVTSAPLPGGGGTAGPADPAALVRAFRDTASPDAFELAVALAAVPLQAEMVDAVCEDVFGEASPSVLAEIYFGGLIGTATTTAETGDGPHALDFRPGVRRRLLALGGSVSEIRRMLLLASDHLASTDPVFANLSRALRGGGDPPTSVALESASWGESVLPAVQSIAIGSSLSVLSRDRTRKGRAQDGAFAVGGARSSLSKTRFEPLSDREELPVQRASTERGGQHFEANERNDMSGHSQRTRPIPPGSAEVGGRPVNAAWIQVPKRNTNFVGRDDLMARLRAKIVESQHQVLTTLNGTSGVGKTELAKEYLYRYSDEYDLICWIPSTYENQIRNAFTQLAARLGLEVAGPWSDNVVHGVLEALRQGHRYSRWLLVFDNAESREDLNMYLPVAGDGHVIITSWDQSWSRGGAETFLSVEKFSRPESVQLLRRRGPAHLTVEEADRIAEELGDLPLALNQAAVWLNEVRMDIDDYLRRLADKGPEMIQLLGPVDPEYSLPVAAAWNVSLDRLSVTNRGALQLLQLCSFMDPAPIPRDLFKFARDIEGPSDLREALRDPALLGMAIRDIGRFSLAQVDHRENTLSLHRLVGVAVRAPMTDAEREELRHCAHQLLARNDPQGDSKEALERYAALLPHVWTTEAWDCEDAWVRELVVQLCRIANRNDEFDVALRFGQKAHDHWAERLGPRQRVTLQMALELSKAFRGLGELDRARELCESTMRTLAEVVGEDAPEYLVAEQEYARNLRMAGRFDESLAVTQSSHENRIRKFGEDDPQTLSAGHFLGFDLLLVGRVREALEQHAGIWNRRQMVLGPDHSQTRASMDGYSDALMESGRYHEARELQQALVDQTSELFGGDDSRVMSLTVTLAHMARRCGRSEEAYELSGLALRRFRHLQGEDALTLYAALAHSLGLYVVNRFDEALTLASEAGEQYVKLLGEDHTHVVSAQVNKAIILRRMERGLEARELDERGMALLTERLGPRHLSTLSCAINLANDHFRSGDVLTALERDEETLVRCTEAHGGRHPVTLLARRNLMLDKWARGEQDHDELQAVRTAYEDVLGAEHPATLSIGQMSRGDADIYFGEL